MKKLLALSLAFLSMTLFQPETKATLMAYPPSIDSLAASSDLVAKVKVLSVAPLSGKNALDTKFWQVMKARVKLVSALKIASGNEKTSGKPSAQNEFEFTYRGDQEAKNSSSMWIDVGPENYPHYKLEAGKSYILFMKPSGQGFTQSSDSYGLRSWQGFFPCADDAPVSGAVKDAIWKELLKAVHSPDKEIEKRAAQALFELSSGTGGVLAGSNDFSREAVNAAIFRDSPPSFVKDGGAAAKEFLAGLGSFSVYLDPSMRWRNFWTKASEPMASWGTVKAHENNSIKPALPYLFKAAADKDPSMRAAAICCLASLDKDPGAARISGALKEWLKDPDPEVRSAALLLSCDYPQYASEQIAALADKSPQVRMAAAFACGLSKNAGAIPKLTNLLKDDSRVLDSHQICCVSASAALSLLAYPTAQVKPVLLANLSSTKFGAGFLAKLAKTNPSEVREQLLAECKKQDPMNHPGDMSEAFMAFQNGLATSPHYACIKALMDYLDGLSGVELGRPEYKAYLDCVEDIGKVDPSHTGRVYEILCTHRLSARASEFKKKAIAAQPAIPPIAFEQVERGISNGALQIK